MKNNYHVTFKNYYLPFKKWLLNYWLIALAGFMFGIFFTLILSPIQIDVYNFVTMLSTVALAIMAWMAYKGYYKQKKIDKLFEVAFNLYLDIHKSSINLYDDIKKFDNKWINIFGEDSDKEFEIEYLNGHCSEIVGQISEIVEKIDLYILQLKSWGDNVVLMLLLSTNLEIKACIGDMQNIVNRLEGDLKDTKDRLSYKISKLDRVVNNTNGKNINSEQLAEWASFDIRFYNELSINRLLGIRNMILEITKNICE